MKTIMNKIKYLQPHNIKLSEFREMGVLNEALKDRTIEYLHNRSKHDAKYRRSKQNRQRGYDFEE